jgi:hypothetical protein
MIQYGGDISQSAKNAGTAVIEGGLQVVESSGQIMGYAGKISSDTAKTAAGLVNVAGDTSVKVATGLGNAVGKASEIVSSTVGAVAITTQRMENSTKEMALRRAEIERQKTAEQKGKTESEIAQIEANTKIQLLNIQNGYDEQQQRLKLEQEQKLDKLNSEQTQQLLNQKDNTNKQQKAYYYGFTKSNPTPIDTGYKKSSVPFSEWCYSYIPQYFVTNEGSVIDISFSETFPSGQRSQNITAINEAMGQNITIGFETQVQKDWKGKPYYLQVPVIKFQESNGETKTLFGKMYYTLIWFVCSTTNRGGRRRTNKRRRNRKTNKRRTNRRTYKRHKTYKRSH